MKRMVMLTALAMAGGLAVAQDRPAGPGADGRKPIPAFSASATPLQSGTNSSARAEVLGKLRQVQQKLGPIAAKIAETDPEIKALVQKQKELQQQYMEAEKKRMELMDARLSADPTAAPLVAQRKELQAKMQEFGVMGGGPRPGGGPGPRRTAPGQGVPGANPAP
jgi:hypothetical protein